MSAPVTGRFAPTPSGRLHLGNVLCCLISYLSARSQGGRGIVRNILTLCPECHRRYDQTTEREKMREFFREYLLGKYPGWKEEDLIYRKGADNG